MENNEKKNKNRFSICLNSVHEQQRFAMDLLNKLPPRSIAIYIAQAIWEYENGASTASRKRGKQSRNTNNTETRNRGSISEPSSEKSSVAETETPELSKAKDKPAKPLSHTKGSIDNPVENTEPQGFQTVNAGMFNSMMGFINGADEN